MYYCKSDYLFSSPCWDPRFRIQNEEDMKTGETSSTKLQGCGTASVWARGNRFYLIITSGNCGCQ
jgi:hypothetical protein